MEDTHVESTLKNSPCARSHVLLSKAFLAAISASIHMARNPGTEHEELVLPQSSYCGESIPLDTTSRRGAGALLPQ